MHVTLRILIGSALALLLASTPLARAVQSSAAAPTLVPPLITSAHSVFVSNGGGPNYFNAFTGGADRGYSQLYAALQQWGRYQIVDSPSQADLILEIRSIAPAVDVSGPNEGSSISYNPQLILRILDPKTNAVLWTTSANVRAFGRQASRDKGFDQSVAVLVDRVRQLTGESLDAAQVKALRTNSSGGKGQKILFASLIGVGVGFTLFTVYKVTNRPALPTLPPCSNPPFCSVSAR